MLNWLHVETPLADAVHWHYDDATTLANLIMDFTNGNRQISTLWAHGADGGPINLLALPRQTSIRDAIMDIIMFNQEYGDAIVSITYAFERQE